MKLNDLNKIEEGLLSSIKDRFAQGGHQTKVQNIFIKDFIQDAMVSINNGIKGGLVQVPQATPAPAQPPAATTTQPPAETPATAQPPVQKMTPSQLATAKSQNKIAPGTATGTGPTPRLTPRDRLMLQRQAKAVKESAYDKMNRVFESIINIDEAGEIMSLENYMMNWFTQYMNGVAWQGSKQIVQDKIAKLAKEYPNNLKPNLQSLAQVGLALSKAATPAGAPQEFTQMRQAGAKDVQQTYEEIKSVLAELSKVNPDLYNKFIKTLTPVAATPGASAGLAEEKKR